MLTAWLMMLAAGVRLVMCCGRSCLADAAGLPRFCFWLGVGSGFCLAALALVISLGFRKS
ncbi:hypothetical protein [Phascolarctobacterium succinatutens]|jgi:hypothetical protein|uniref:hypothetical protein n=1 Tax=Phascolarctobacterium succinatutens TaxID=626940 RepID=UPI002062BD9D|nr:MAG: hypothetical protein [Bacteriophage sp.]DAX10553.1 MAG TPA: hypothetical protein [Bacteriophage sp.]